MALPRPHRDEIAALAMEDLASALDAGLPMEPGADGAHRSALSALTARGVELEASDRAILEAAEQAGELTRALRERAASRQLRAALVRSLLASLRYPLLLTVVAVLVGLFVSSIIGSGVAPILLAGMAPLLLLSIALLVRMSMRSPGTLPMRVPLLGPILRDLGELPYLQTLRGLYAAGIPILTAHPLAVGTIPVVAIRQSLEVADNLLQRGQPLSEALEAAAALSAETRGILATGEAAGDLEGALHRAAVRRGDTLRHRAERGTRVLGRAVYFMAVGLAVYVILSFYSGLYGGLLGR
jgi:general secretion pathway protein F